MKQSALRHKVTVPSLLARKERLQSGARNRISALTAYDFTTARLVDRAGVDMILVGDSVGCVVQGHANTLPVSLEEMIYHSRCVVRGVEYALVVGDMPFMSYQVSLERGVESACRLVKEGGVSAVKIEGGIHVSSLIERLTEIDVPVVGHVGLTPQSYHRMGGHKRQGREHARDGRAAAAGTYERILEDARAVERAGAFTVVLEGVPDDLAATITEELSIPTIGIGAGAACDGQILVVNDMLGLDPDFRPKFVKRYAELGEQAVRAIETYVGEVRDGAFPATVEERDYLAIRR